MYKVLLKRGVILVQLPYNGQPLLLPGASPEMLDPEFWCARFWDLSLDDDWLKEIKVPYNAAIKDYLKNISSQWEDLINEDGSPLSPKEIADYPDWWSQPEYGLITHPIDLKLLPRDEPLFSVGSQTVLDRNQLSGLDPGEPVYLFGVSPDGNWYGVVSDAGIGWVKQDAVGIGSKNQIQDYQDDHSRLTIIDPNPKIILGDGIIRASMGSSFPLNDHIRRTIMIPGRNSRGSLKFKTGIIIEEAVRDHLPKTAHHIIRQAFKYLGYPYAWGDRDLEGYGRDCSRLVMDVLRTMGFRPPRNSREQLAAGKKRINLSSMSIPKRLTRLKKAPPGSLLFTPSHVMFLLGEYQGEIYVIHALSSYRQIINNKEEPVKAKQVVVSGLSLGLGASTGSLLEQLTEVIEVQNETNFSNCSGNH